MAGRYIKDEVIDVTARAVTPEEPETPQYEASQYKPTGIFARTVTRFLMVSFTTSIALTGIFGWRAYKVSEITGNPFMWEFGFQIGITSPWVFVGSYVLIWMLHPYLTR